MSFLDRFRRKRSNPAADPREVYSGLRAQAMSWTPEALGADPASDAIYGVLFDIGVGHGSAATFVSMADGTTSMYTSTGGGVLGGGDHAGAAAASRALIAHAQEARGLFSHGSTDGAPDDGWVRFIVLAPSGPLVASGDCDELARGDLPLSSMFLLANEVMTQLRLLSS